MGNIRQPAKVLLFAGMLSSDPEAAAEAEEALIERFGPFCCRSDELSFPHTHYYEREMGPGIIRRFVAFDRLVSRDCLPEVKHFTNGLEERLSHQGRRRVNLDPGLLTQENVNLATTKPYSHRTYLTDGIWSEVTLMFGEGDYQTLPWTYPDYASREVRDILLEMRNIYRRRLTCPAV